MAEPADVAPLYVPAAPQDSRIHKFLRRANATRSLSLASYSDLYEWSIEHTDEFWSDVWDDTGVLGHKGDHVVNVSALPPVNPTWFSQARLNWAENMLQCRSPDKVALIEASMSNRIPSLLHQVLTGLFLQLNRSQAFRTHPCAARRMRNCMHLLPTLYLLSCPWDSNREIALPPTRRTAS